MAIAHFRFYEELNDFLPPERRKTRFAHSFQRRSSIKDMIESLGVPHPEIDLILANGNSVDFSYIVQDRDDISVYPVFERLDITPLIRLRPRPLRHTLFVADCNLGRLARYLRLLGFDCLYANDFSDAEVAAISHETQRVLLTRDRRLLQRRIITHGLFVRATDPKKQVKEIMTRLDLYRQAAPFTRCTRCNGLLEPVAKNAVDAQLEPRTRLYFEDFLRCSDCGQVYWQGSHFNRVKPLVDEFLERQE